MIKQICGGGIGTARCAVIKLECGRKGSCKYRAKGLRLSGRKQTGKVDAAERLNLSRLCGANPHPHRYRNTKHPKGCFFIYISPL